LNDIGSPAFVGRRQRHHRCRASTLLDFEPTSEGAEAGLTVRANEKNHYELFLTRASGERVVRLRTRIDEVSRIVGGATVAAGPVLLEIRAREDRYEFFASSGGEAPRSLGTAEATPLSTEAAGGFTGVYFGMYAAAISAGSASPADFDWFEYMPES
jgi:alpha-N-arabinofuranosidase